jgi:hypothetical protein
VFDNRKRKKIRNLFDQQRSSQALRLTISTQLKRHMNQSILFGRTHPWPSFRAINDTVRGGASTSSFITNSNNVATFEGNLDITALGGAGFASQCTTFSPSLKFSRVNSTGLALTLLSPPSSIDSEKSPPTSFVLALKSEIPADRPDGRRESVMSYEFTWDMKSLASNQSNGEVRIEATWEECEASPILNRSKKVSGVEQRYNFDTIVIPMFRGRQPTNPEPLNLNAIHE